MKVVFIGAVQFSRSALEHLIGLGTAITGVCTLENSDINADHCDLSSLCEAHGIPWIYASNINSEQVVQWITARKPDVIFCFGWSRLLRPPLLQLAPLGVVGFHPTALPANRGRHPLIWALALGLERTAATFFLMDERVDAGDILSQEEIAIEEHDDAATLYHRITRSALSQMDTFVPQLAAGSIIKRVQDESKANTWRKRHAADGKIDWRMSSRSIHNLVRALAKPYGGAHFVYSGGETKVWSTEVVEDRPANIEPGRVMAVTSRGPVVACGEQAILLLKTEPATRLTTGDYL
jgi:methionyl-tRNA formyltransferase